MTDPLYQALALHQAGDLRRAEPIYRQILADAPGHPEALRLLAALCFMSDRLAEAESLLRQSTEGQPDNPASWDLFGTLLAKQGRLDEAIGHYQKALAIKPDLPETYSNLATVYIKKGQRDQALEHLEHALRLKPKSVGALEQKGTLLAQKGEWSAAESALRQSLLLEPRNISALVKLGKVLKEQDKLPEAQSCFLQATTHQPQHAEAQSQLASVLMKQGLYLESIEVWHRALTLRPDATDLLANLGMCLSKLDRVDEATACFQRATEIDPTMAEAFLNWGCVLAEEGKTDEAIRCYRRCLELKPDMSLARTNWGIALARRGRWKEAEAICRDELSRAEEAGRHVALGSTLRMQGRLDEARASFETALSLDPRHAEAHRHRAALWLLHGDLRRGFEEFEWRWVDNEEMKLPRLDRPAWTGEDLRGKTLLIYTEQGQGDVIQFARFFPLLKERGARTIFLGKPEILPLLKGAPGIDLLAPSTVRWPSYDLHAPMMSMARLLRINFNNLPAQTPYLFAEEDRIARWKTRLDREPGLKVGISWQGNKKYHYDYFRSIPLKHFAPLAKIPGVKLVSLQKGFGTEQIQTSGLPLLDWSAELDQDAAFLDTAALMKSLDLVITSDTVTAHLAGALGIPVWVALCFQPDWRWLLEREDSPWYPTMRLFRQTTWMNWDGVFARVAEELRAYKR